MSGQPRSSEWTVRLLLRESDGAMIAVAELVDDHEATLSAKGQFHSEVSRHRPTVARRELAAARALQRLADLLVLSATRDLSG